MKNITKKIYSTVQKYLFLIVVVIPNILFTYYQTMVATPRFESRTKIIVEQPDNSSTLDTGLALLSGFGVSKHNQDTQLVKSYILSQDMLHHLEQVLSLREHYSMSDADSFSRLQEDSSQEEFYQYYLNRIRVEIDEKSSVVSIFAQAFTPEMSLKISQEITGKAEWFINNVGHQLANAQLRFIKNEYSLAQSNLQENKIKLIEFQRKYNLFDPKQDSMAISQISYGIEGKIAEKSAELKALKSVMNKTSPRVMALENEISALSQQLELEKLRLVGERIGKGSLSLNEILNQYSALKIDLEMALSAFTSTTLSLEKARIEAYRKIKYLIVVESPKMPEDRQYPKVIYNISLLFMMSIVLFGIIRIFSATVRELR
ncbi:lipopolysaccharide biosynthesis protein [Vibrio metschnikovii]|uniref:lipopolysaccharide biosynthesis protein n=1 Tax=Vibrio metschnikovii TaxID=28172 RepID=UPI001C2FB039|nr:lipopolysaccharide biosynthesis protein [Vibrio metschnikovii]